MSDNDSELERLKAKRLEEMQRNISSQKKSGEEQSSVSGQQQPQQSSQDKSGKMTSSSPQKHDHRQIVVNRLGYRGLEVLQNAEFQFPNEVPFVIQKLAQLLHSGELNEELDGGKLLALFRSIGLNVRMETRINVEKDGKLVSLSDKLSSDGNDTNPDGDN